jgi:hypothetical protein
MSLVVKVSVRSRVLFPGDDLECTISLAPLHHHQIQQQQQQPSNSTKALKQRRNSVDDDASLSAEKSNTDSDSLVVMETEPTNESSLPAPPAPASTTSGWSWWNSWFGSSSSVSSSSSLESASHESLESALVFDEAGHALRRRAPPVVDYVSVNVVGKYVADSSWIRLSPAYAQQPAAADSSRLLFESAPSVVAEGVDSCLVRYTFPLPRKIPPSFKGVAVKYFYCIRVAARLRAPNAVERVVSIPLRVINPLGNIAVIQVAPKPALGIEPKLHDLQPLEADDRHAVQLTDTMAHAASAIELLGSPLVRARQRVTVASPAASAADALTSPQLRVASLSSYYRRLQREQQSQNVQNNVKALFAKLSRPLSIEISRARRHVAQFTVNRTAFQLGDVIVGQFDFSRASTSCYQVSCSLDYDEAVAVEMQPSASAAAAAAAAPLTDSSALASAVIPSTELMPRASVEPVAVPPRYAGSTTLRKTVAEAHSITVHTLRTGMSLAIPSHAPYSFATSHVRVSWTLRFEFAIAARSRTDGDDQVDADGVHGDALAQPAVDCLHWELPIQVLVPEKPDEFLFERDSERMVV